MKFAGVLNAYIPSIGFPCSLDLNIDSVISMDGRSGNRIAMLAR